jgi:hypothetical protein
MIAVIVIGIGVVLFALAIIMTIVEGRKEDRLIEEARQRYLEAVQELVETFRQGRPPNSPKRGS